MTKKAYIAIGHGKNSSGVYDPGSSSGDYVEHDLAHKIAEEYATALRRCGFSVMVEQDDPFTGEHDQNYATADDAANAYGADFADAIHFNAGGGSGTEVLTHAYTGQVNKDAAARMCELVSTLLPLPNRGQKDRTDLGFLNNVSGHAAIVEVAFIDSAADQQVIDRDDFVTTVAEALTRARCEYAGVAYVPEVTVRARPRA